MSDEEKPGSDGITSTGSAEDSASPASDTSQLPAEQGGEKKGFQKLFLVTPEERAVSREAARFVRKYPPELKAAILEDIKPRLVAGERMDDLAREHGIPTITLYYWLGQLGDEHKQLRRAWIDHKLLQAEENLANAPNKLEVLRWKEMVRVAQWYAERRDPERYAPKSEVTLREDEPRSPEQIQERIKQLEERLGIRTIENEAQAAGQD